jgi:DNA-binding NtrC family response regulator
LEVVMSVLTQTVEQLRTATSFEQGSQQLLQAVMAVAQQACQADPQARSMRILRVMLHLRSGGSYQGLVTLPGPGLAEGAAPKGQWLLPSATVWRHVEEHGQALAVALLMGTIRLVESGRTVRWSAQQAAGSEDLSMQRLLDRDATHLYAIPLRAPGGVIRGMISIELSTAALTASLSWRQHAAGLQLLADVATPALLLLPRQVEQPSVEDPLLPVVGRLMGDTVRLLSVFATMEETILVSGPTGAGKSRLAQWIHARSARSKGPFETVDLLTVPPQTQMAELFGWRRGAFTGAVSDQRGFVARASGGTLFIDEVDKLSLEAQAGLLQLLETRSYRPLGSNAGPIRADLRFVVGTNANLPAAIREGRFREDLYYRINVLPVRLPPLSEREDEIGGWAGFMLQRRHQELGQAGAAHFSDPALALLARADWPGNLRQLDNTVRRAYAMRLAEGLAASDLVVDAPHVTRALGLELGSSTSNALQPALLESLDVAAECFVALADRQLERGQPLDLDHVLALRGAVLRQALASTGDLKEAYLLFGRDAVVASRNHSRDYRRELERLGRLEEACEDIEG